MKLTFVKKQKEVGEVWSYYFKPGVRAIFQAGQYINLTMPDVPPAVADRIFTIASAPHQDNLQFTTIRGDSLFKQKLDSLNPSEVIESDQLGGDFTYELTQYQSEKLPKEIQKNIRRMFIAGGIGVTPFISIIRDRINKKQPINAKLLYAGRENSRPFLEEIKQATKKDPTFKLANYSTKRLNLEALLEDFTDINQYLIYLAGSQSFVENLGEGLYEKGLPRSQIKYDYFDGYENLEY